VSGEFDLPRLYHAGALVGAALLLEHLACYDEELFKREPEAVLLGSNVLGVLTIAVGYGIAKRSPTPALEVVTIAMVGASVVVALRIARRSQRLDRAVQFLAGRIIERIEGALDNDQSYTRNGPRGF